MSRSDGIDELDPRFPIHLGPQSPAFWQELWLWQAAPSPAAQAFARDEAAHAVELNAREETTFIQPLPPPEDLPAVEFVPRPREYPELHEDTLTRDFVPLPPLPEETVA